MLLQLTFTLPFLAGIFRSFCRGFCLSKRSSSSSIILLDARFAVPRAVQSYLWQACTRV